MHECWGKLVFCTIDRNHFPLIQMVYWKISCFVQNFFNSSECFLNYAYYAV